MRRREKGWGGERRDGEKREGMGRREKVERREKGWEERREKGWGGVGGCKHHLSIPHSDSLMSLLQLTHTTLVLRA